MPTPAQLRASVQNDGVPVKAVVVDHTTVILLDIE
jgi:hypothetical protein